MATKRFIDIKKIHVYKDGIEIDEPNWSDYPLDPKFIRMMRDDYHRIYGDTVSNRKYLKLIRKNIMKCNPMYLEFHNKSKWSTWVFPVLIPLVFLIVLVIILSILSN